MIKSIIEWKFLGVKPKVDGHGVKENHILSKLILTFYTKIVCDRADLKCCTYLVTRCQFCFWPLITESTVFVTIRQCDQIKWLIHFQYLTPFTTMKIGTAVEIAKEGYKIFIKFLAEVAKFCKFWPLCKQPLKQSLSFQIDDDWWHWPSRLKIVH